MTAHAAMLGPETGFHEKPLRAQLVKSVAIHAALLLGSVGWSLFQGTPERMGDPNAGGASVGISIVEEAIPIPTRGKANPLASDSKSDVPQVEADTPKPAEVVPEPKPDAVELPIPTPAPKQTKAKQPPREETKTAAVEPRPSTPNRFRPFDEQVTENQLKSSSAQAVSNPMFSEQAGAGRISTGQNTTLGDRFGAYAATVRDIVSRNWNTETVSAGIRSAPPAVATFEIQRRGQAVNYKLLQSSGNAALDLTIQRAIQNSSPFPSLPSAFPNDRATVEFVFELKR